MLVREKRLSTLFSVNTSSPTSCRPFTGPEHRFRSPQLHCCFQAVAECLAAVALPRFAVVLLLVEEAEVVAVAAVAEKRGLENSERQQEVVQVLFSGTGSTEAS